MDRSKSNRKSLSGKRFSGKIERKRSINRGDSNEAENSFGREIKKAKGIDSEPNTSQKKNSFARGANTSGIKGKRRNTDSFSGKRGRNYDNSSKSKPKRHVKETSQVREASDEVRLNKYIASSGICSRREADKLIADGLVTVNGEVVTILGTKVKPSDVVEYGGEKLRFEKFVYLLLNKPKNVITTSDDPQGRLTVMDIMSNTVKERIYPVGRLDRMTTGLLLMTNDGDLAKKLAHPKYKVQKVYHVALSKPVTRNDMKKLTEGVELEDGIAIADAVSYVGDGTNKNEIGISLHSGKNRVIRRMMETLGYSVSKLDRVSFAGLTKKNIPRGKWRTLNEREVGMLKMISYV
ncbi:MAG: pseudouridylate synthase [Crocinitomicaceae bacterium]|nr:pseudouridylate synthase [Crocinitomicaceae bacterium]|tara:strand:+ start:6946 stop:7995 length:1050 start_codon:yes stop_codon:yes gene_type:complete